MPNLVRDGARERQPVGSNRLDDRLYLGKVPSPLGTEGGNHRELVNRDVSACFFLWLEIGKQRAGGAGNVHASRNWGDHRKDVLRWWIA